MITYKGKIIVIAGPTASGKSDIAIKLANDIGGYIINGDSRQLYKHLNIGTAKPTPEKVISDREWIVSGIKHHLYDFVDPKENYTLFDYQKEVQRVLDREEGIPILVGGTGLYIDSIIYNYILTKNSDSENNLSKLSLSELKHLAKDYLNELNESDRENKHRLIRVIQRGGVNRKKGEKLNNQYFVIDLDKEELANRVKQRTDKMFKEGLLEENIKLLEMGYTYNDKGMNSIGYIEFKEYFNKTKTLEEVKEDIYNHTLSYSKRQRTWFRRNKEAIWTNNYSKIIDLVSNFISTE
jgi:tRNA dimethylallyltransferase